MRITPTVGLNRVEGNRLKRQAYFQISIVTFVGASAILLLLEPVSAKAVANDAATLSDQDVTSLGSSKPSERKDAEDRIQKAGPGGIPTLINGLDNSNQSVRERTAWLLRQLAYQFKSLPNDVVAGQIGRRVHTEKNHKARFEMVNALREYSGPVAISELKQVAAQDADWDIRLYAIHYIATTSVDPSKEIAFFRKTATDSNKAVQLASYSELARLGDKSTRPVALQALSQSTDWYERREAVGILGAVGNPSDLPLLQGLIDSKSVDAEMRLRVVHEYKNIQLSQLAENRKLDYLITSLDDPEWDVRNWAYVRLWKFRDPNTNARLKAYLGEKGHRGYDEAANTLQLRSSGGGYPMRVAPRTNSSHMEIIS